MLAVVRALLDASSSSSSEEASTGAAPPEADAGGVGRRRMLLIAASTAVGWRLSRACRMRLADSRPGMSVGTAAAALPFLVAGAAVVAGGVATSAAATA